MHERIANTHGIHNTSQHHAETRKEFTTLLQLFDSSTLRFFSSSILQLFDSSALRFFNSSILQLFNSSTLRFFKSSPGGDLLAIPSLTLTEKSELKITGRGHPEGNIQFSVYSACVISRRQSFYH
jgi:hypothetical protein